MKQQRVLSRELAPLRTGAGIAGRVQAALADSLAAGKGTLADVAGELARSPSELQRCLEQAGTSFRAEVGQVRRALAEQYLRDPSLPVV